MVTLGRTIFSTHFLPSAQFKMESWASITDSLKKQPQLNLTNNNKNILP